MLAYSVARSTRKRFSPYVSCLSTLSSLSSSRPSPHIPRQRRFSSSKTSSPPNDDSTPVSAPSETPAASSSARPGVATRKRPTTRLTRPRTKDALPKSTETIANTEISQLPSAPSTHHLHPHDVHMASFFSLHRPMSVTAVIPPYSSPSTFSSIFTPRVQQKQRPADVIYTLSVAVNTFEKAATHTEHQQKESQPAPIASNARPLTLDGLRTAVTQASASNAEPNSTSHLDGQPSPTVYINIEEIARKFRPFNPPPAPVPMPAPEESEARLSHALPKPAPAKAVPLSPSFFEAAPTSWASLKEVLKKKLVASGWETFRQRMRNRNLQWQIVRVERRRQMWQAISVKRQRRLKIKKHKYKKLMRRTKNLRRRLDRL